VIWAERKRRLINKTDLDKVLQPGKEPKSLRRVLEMTARADPVLAEVWHNEKEVAYDRIKAWRRGSGWIYIIR